MTCVNSDLKLLCVDNVQERKRHLRLQIENITSDEVRLEVKKFSENEILNKQFQLNKDLP